MGRKKKTPGSVVSKADYFRQWYQDHKKELSDKRKKLYAEDAAYRNARKEASKAQNGRNRVAAPAGYSIALEVAAEQVGITVWAMREWRRKNYFPEPLHHAGRLWFTE